MWFHRSWGLLFVHPPVHWTFPNSSPGSQTAPLLAFPISEQHQTPHSQKQKLLDSFLLTFPHLLSPRPGDFMQTSPSSPYSPLPHLCPPSYHCLLLPSWLSLPWIPPVPSTWLSWHRSLKNLSKSYYSSTSKPSEASHYHKIKDFFFPSILLSVSQLNVMQKRGFLKIHLGN